MKAKMAVIGLRIVLVFGMGLTAANSLAHPSRAAENTPSATPIVGGNSFVSASVVAPNIEYSAAVSGTHTNDYFYFDVSPGQVATMAFSSTTTWGNGVNFRLWDQAHVNAIKGLFVGGASQANQFVYVGNSTTPTRYYFQATVNGAALNAYFFQVNLADQIDGDTPGDAGDGAPTARVISPTLGSATVFSGTLGNVDLHDWYRISAVSGQIISVSVSVLEYGGSTYLATYLEDQTPAVLSSSNIMAPDATSKTHQWISNNSAPSAYLLRLTSSVNNGQPMRYRFEVALYQQNDANSAGDAGDDFNSARAITLTKASPVLDAPGNLLGAADDDDYLLIKLPEIGLGETLPRYRIFVTPMAWPGPAGYLRLQFYDAQRNPLTALNSTINAPSVSPYSAEITSCGSTGCYLRLSSGFAGYNPITYAIGISPIALVYLPLMSR